MSSFFQTAPPRDPEATPAPRRVGNPWTAALAVLATVLVLGGVIAVIAGFGLMASSGDAVLGQSPGFDDGFAAAVVGGAVIVLGIVVGTCWLVLGALGWSRRR
jgi:hypothetical protein